MNEILDIFAYYYDGDTKTEFSIQEYTTFSAHCPNNIFIDVKYLGDTPKKCVCLVSQGDLSAEGYEPISYRLLSGYDAVPYSNYIEDGINVITFIFSLSFLKQYMHTFDDIESDNNILQYLPNMTEFFYFQILCDNTQYPTSAYYKLILRHNTLQIGNNNNTYDEYYTTYYGGNDLPVYIYCYLPDVGELKGSVVIEQIEYTANDYDDLIFYDYDDEFFKINID